MPETEAPNDPSQDASPTPETKKKLPARAHLLCAWPLILVAFGGAIGGGLGGLAYGVNVGIYKSKMPVALKILCNLLVGVAAFALWLLIGGAIAYKVGR